MNIKSNPEVKQVFDRYPKHIKPKLTHLRGLVLAAASEVPGLNNLEETLKWGEPSYLTKHGSTVRMDWKEKAPDHYAVYFKCTSRLVPTFKHLYGDTFEFEGDRAIVFKLDDEIPEAELKHCFTMALTYHKVKHFPLLGA